MAVIDLAAAASDREDGARGLELVNFGTRGHAVSISLTHRPSAIITAVSLARPLTTRAVQTPSGAVPESPRAGGAHVRCTTHRPSGHPDASRDINLLESLDVGEAVFRPTVRSLIAGH